MVGILFVYALFSKRHIQDAVGFQSASRSSTRYGIMIDAGSTGSRVHVYEFTMQSSGALKLIDELFVQVRMKIVPIVFFVYLTSIRLVHTLTRHNYLIQSAQVKPGLSSFKDDGNIDASVAKSLGPLIEDAQKRVPSQLHSSTPIFMFATAGLRLLDTEKQDIILKSARQVLNKSGFLVGGGDGGVEIIDGKREGVFGWMTVNFLLKNFETSSSTTTGIMDMGGASTQIVYEVSDSQFASIAPEDRHEMFFGGKKHKLYVHSHLGYGLMEAGKKILAGDIEKGECISTSSKSNSTCTFQTPNYIPNPT